MKIFLKFLPMTLSAFIVSFVFMFICVLSVEAQTQQGIVPCSGPDCDFNKLIELVQRVIDFLLVGIAVPLAMILFAYAGALYLTAAGDTGQIERGHKMFMNVLLGLVFALAAWLVIKILVSVLISGKFPREFLFINLG